MPRSGASRIPRPVKIPSESRRRYIERPPSMKALHRPIEPGSPILDTVSARISPAQNVLFWCSIGRYSYDKIADHSGGYFSTARELGGIQSVT